MPSLSAPLVKVRAYRAEEVSFSEPECGFFPDVRDVHLVTHGAYVIVQMPGRWEWLYMQGVDSTSLHELGCHYVDREFGYCYLWMRRRGGAERQWIFVDQPVCRLEVERIFDRMCGARCELLEVRVGIDRLQPEKIGSRPIFVES